MKTEGPPSSIRMSRVVYTKREYSWARRPTAACVPRYEEKLMSDARMSDSAF
jgi:hypothetical protein